MSEKFTPGPWYMSFDSRNCPSVRSKGGYVCFAPSITNYGDPLRYIDEATEVQANAHLIAAALDMYKALKDLERISGQASMIDDPARVAARAALAKADGTP